MKTFALQTDEFKEEAERLLPLLANRVVAANVPDFARGSGYLWHKGDILRNNAELVLSVSGFVKNAPAGYALHLIQLDESDVTEDEAGLVLARLIAGPGLQRRGPVESRYNLIARERGLLRIDLERLENLNEVPGVAVFTLFNHQPVEAGTEVCGVKVTPLVYPRSRLTEAEAVCAGNPVVDVLPFRPRQIGVVYREVLKSSVRDRFVATVKQKLDWFGAHNTGLEEARGEKDELVARFKKFKAAGTELLLHVGGHSSDPLDPVFEALDELGAVMVRQGAPAHPGTLFWLARWDNMSIFGIASCGMFSRTTLGDIFLAMFCAGMQIGSREIARMGHGGLFTADMGFRFPSYGLKADKE